MSHDLQRADEPLPELEAYMRVIACAAALVRTAGPLGPEVKTVDTAVLDRLRVALAAVGIGDEEGP